VPVNRAERAGGESKLRGGKAVRVVLTVTRTLLDAKLLRRRRSGSYARADTDEGGAR
jgi:hypothetical protein